MKWKLNIRREIKVAVSLLAISFLIAFSERKQGGSVCKDIVIELDNLHGNHFLDEADVMKLVEGSGQSIRGVGIDHIDLKTIERKIKYDKHIHNQVAFQISK